MKGKKSDHVLLSVTHNGVTQTKSAVGSSSTMDTATNPFAIPETETNFKSSEEPKQNGPVISPAASLVSSNNIEYVSYENSGSLYSIFHDLNNKGKSNSKPNFSQRHQENQIQTHTTKKDVGTKFSEKSGLLSSPLSCKGVVPMDSNIENKDTTMCANSNQDIEQENDNNCPQLSSLSNEKKKRDAKHDTHRSFNQSIECEQAEAGASECQPQLPPNDVSFGSTSPTENLSKETENVLSIDTNLEDQDTNTCHNSYQENELGNNSNSQKFSAADDKDMKEYAKVVTCHLSNASIERKQAEESTKVPAGECERQKKSNNISRGSTSFADNLSSKRDKEDHVYNQENIETEEKG